MTTHIDSIEVPQRATGGIWERLLAKACERLARGTLVLVDQGRRREFGAGEPRATITVREPRFYRRVVLGGTVGAGEAYMDGDWVCDDLVALVRVFALNAEALGDVDGSKTLSVQLRNLLQHATRRNSKLGSRRNIEAHYDLSNEFFSTFLDERLMYSAASYETADQSLEAASEAKLARLCQKLELGPQDHLLEIGSGWGGLAIYAAQHFGCRVTTTTISPAQHELASARVREAGLSDRIEVLLRDYRELEGTYDKLVSVEMVEAVGHQYLPEYFATIDRLLKPAGLFALQAITIEDRRYQQALTSVDFIKKHIFPGSFIPCASELISQAASHTRSVLVNFEDMGHDYALTLRAWRARFWEQQPRIRELGFDDRFVRMWDFYLAYCEGGFLERAISDVQLLFAKPDYRGRPWRRQLA